ncbi:hypothetical protein FPV67DRAFT_1534240 [Lyophyllum atratum]|nr:hypothetical protein FPV67DRAFT_1534240 [Lyophyllum atratum]
MVPPRHAKRSSSRGSMSISSDGQSLPASSNISDVEEMGGISSGSDVGERKEREGLREVKSGFHKVKLLAKVEPTTSVADYIPPSTAAQKVKNKQDIRAREDLPVHLKYAFDARFLPKLREALGVVRAWERPTDAQVRSIWEEVFPDEELGGWLETVVKKLVDGCISNWRTKMASTALESFKRIVVKTLVQQHPEATPKQLSEAIAGWCKWALQGDYKERPFYYLVYEEVEVEAKEGAEGFEEDVEPELVISAKGLFLHPLILATLAYHYSSISQIHQDARSDERPEGALVTAIQACQRAVSRWYSGDFLPLARPAGDFSKDNWGDNPTRVPTNFPQLPPVVLADPKSTSQLYRLVKRLSNSQWEKIIEGAIGAMRRQKAITVQALPDVVDAASSDFELHDDDDDV